MKKVSIIIPVYNEEENLRPLMNVIKAMSLASADNFDFEVVFIDDGSSDSSLNVLKELFENNDNVRVVSITKNSGSHIACHAGLEYATGDYFAVIAADMQDPPSIIPEMIKMMKDGVKIVWGVRRSREDLLSVKLFSKIYYILMKRYVFDNIPEKGADTFLIDMDARNLILKLDEKDTSIFGLLLWSGYSQVFYEYDKKKRERGKSKWTFGKKFKLFIDSFVSFSYLPVRLISVMGIFTSFVAVLIAVHTLWDWYTTRNAPRGYPTMMLVILTLSSIQFLILGVLGEYLWRAFEHIKGRPLYIVKEKFLKDKNS